MSKLTYTAITSLDGYIEDEGGRFDWAMPDAEARHAFSAGLVDEIHLFVFPVVVGGGKPGLPRDVRVDLELLDERRFGNGAVHLRYGAK